MVLEEYLFRGIVFRRLADLLPTAAAVVVSSLAFAAAHLPGWLILGHGQGPRILWLAGSVTLLGCLLALLYRASGTLAVPMAVHAANNILSGWRL